ncbi:MAG: ATP synthase subunit I [Eubacterium sp.]
MKSKNTVLADLLLGMIIYCIIGELIILIFLSDKVMLSVGFVIGVALAIFSAFHMADAIEVSVRMSEEEALKHTRIKYLIRVIILVIILVIMLVTKIGNPIALIIGMMGLKIAAYAQPLTHKLTEKLVNRERR